MAILRVLVVEVKVPEVVGATSISIVLGMVILTVESRARVAVVSDSSAETGVGREGKRKAESRRSVVALRVPVIALVALGVDRCREKKLVDKPRSAEPPGRRRDKRSPADLPKRPNFALLPQNFLAPLELVSNKCPPPQKLIFAHARTLEL